MLPQNFATCEQPDYNCKYLLKINASVLPNMDPICYVLYQITNDFILDVIQHSYSQEDSEM
jgi:hypothetical protein